MKNFYNHVAAFGRKLAFVVAFLSISAFAFAQQRVTGTVTDANGKWVTPETSDMGTYYKECYPSMRKFSSIYWIKNNPNILNFDESKHQVRPIPQSYLDAIANAAEFGNNGY